MEVTVTAREGERNTDRQPVAYEPMEVPNGHRKQGGRKIN